MRNRLIFVSAVALLVTAEGAFAEPAIRGVRAKATNLRAAPQPDSGYYVPYATGPNGEKVPVMDIPGSISVIPRQVMDDQATTSVCGALGNAAGVSCR